MSQTHQASLEHPLTLLKTKIPNFEISWTGEKAWNQTFCFGSEHGQVVFSNGMSLLNADHGLLAAESREAINGVAFSYGLMAVLTRSELALWKIAGPNFRAIRRLENIDSGSHEVRVTASGNIVAPLGMAGIITIELRSGALERITNLKSPNSNANYYKTVGTRTIEGDDVLTSAARQDGLVTMLRIGARIRRTSIESPEFDFVDVCSLGLESFPLDVASPTVCSALAVPFLY